MQYVHLENVMDFRAGQLWNQSGGANYRKGSVVITVKLHFCECPVQRFKSFKP